MAESDHRDLVVLVLLLVGLIAVPLWMSSAAWTQPLGVYILSLGKLLLTVLGLIAAVVLFGLAIYAYESLTKEVPDEVRDGPRKDGDGLDIRHLPHHGKIKPRKSLLGLLGVLTTLAVAFWVVPSILPSGRGSGADETETMLETMFSQSSFVVLLVLLLVAGFILVKGDYKTWKGERTRRKLEKRGGQRGATAAKPFSTIWSITLFPVVLPIAVIRSIALLIRHAVYSLGGFLTNSGMVEMVTFKGLEVLMRVLARPWNSLKQRIYLSIRILVSAVQVAKSWTFVLSWMIRIGRRICERMEGPLFRLLSEVVSDIRYSCGLLAHFGGLWGRILMPPMASWLIRGCRRLALLLKKGINETIWTEALVEAFVCERIQASLPYIIEVIRVTIEDCAAHLLGVCQGTTRLLTYVVSYTIAASANLFACASLIFMPFIDFSTPTVLLQDGVVQINGFLTGSLSILGRCISKAAASFFSTAKPVVAFVYHLTVAISSNATEITSAVMMRSITPIWGIVVAGLHVILPIVSAVGHAIIYWVMDCLDRTEKAILVSGSLLVDSAAVAWGEINPYIIFATSATVNWVEGPLESVMVFLEDTVVGTSKATSPAA